MKCVICGAAHVSCGGPSKLKHKPVGWGGEWTLERTEDDEMLITAIKKDKGVGDDFIANEDIFVDGESKVVQKKDARTKLASKGARVSAADVEKYRLTDLTRPAHEEIETKTVQVEQPTETSAQKSRKAKQ